MQGQIGSKSHLFHIRIHLLGKISPQTKDTDEIDLHFWRNQSGEHKLLGSRFELTQLPEQQDRPKARPLTPDAL